MYIYIYIYIYMYVCMHVCIHENVPPLLIFHAMSIIPLS